jgi:hypothetical protein
MKGGMVLVDLDFHIGPRLADLEHAFLGDQLSLQACALLDGRSVESGLCLSPRRLCEAKDDGRNGGSDGKVCFHDDLRG